MTSLLMVNDDDDDDDVAGDNDDDDVWIFLSVYNGQMTFKDSSLAMIKNNDCDEGDGFHKDDDDLEKTVSGDQCSGEWWEIGKDNFSVTKTCVGIAQMAKHTNTNTMIHMQNDNYKTCVGM